MRTLLPCTVLLLVAAESEAVLGELVDPVVGDVEVEVAVVVEVAPCRRRRPVAIPDQPGSLEDF